MNICQKKEDRKVVTTTSMTLLGSLRFDDGNVNDNATNQWFDWLNEEYNRAARAARLFGTLFWRSLPNDGVKFSYLRFWQQRELAAVNLSLFCLYMKTIRTKQAKVQFAYFVQRDQHGKNPKRLNLRKVQF